MAAKRSKFQDRLDGFLRGLFFEENGKPKSASLLYSFLLSILFVLVHGAAYLLLLDPLEQALGGLPVGARNLAEYILPALAGAGACLLLALLIGRRWDLAAGAYLWMGLLLAGMMVFELFLIDWSDAGTEYGLFMALLGFPALASVLAGGIPSRLLCRRERKRRAAAAGKRPARSGG